MSTSIICHWITLTISVFGIFGNVLCGLVQFSKYMPRSSYIYLLRGLTISDFCLLTLDSFRTMDNLGIIELGTDPYTSNVTFFWDWISTSATKYFTVAIAIERFFVIFFPLRAHMVLTPERSKVSACLIFGFCVLLSTFSYIYTTWIDADSFHFYVAIVLHFLPFLLVLIFNILIFIGLRRARNNSVRKNSTATKEDYSITRMLFTIVLVFGICYSFEFVRRVMNFTWKDYMNKYEYYEYTINNLADIFYVLNSSVNFLIYCALGKSFRAVFLKVFGIGDKGSKVISNSKSDNTGGNSSGGADVSKGRANSDKSVEKGKATFSASVGSIPSKDCESLASMESNLEQI